jgi:hypothetical protein
MRGSNPSHHRLGERKEKPNNPSAPYLSAQHGVRSEGCILCALATAPNDDKARSKQSIEAVRRDLNSICSFYTSEVLVPILWYVHTHRERERQRSKIIFNFGMRALVEKHKIILQNQRLKYIALSRI